MDRLAEVDSLIVQQRKEMAEIFTGFETKNKYVVLDSDGELMFVAAEVAGSLLARLFLKAQRPFTIVVADTEGNEILRAVRPFRFFFYEVTIYDGDGRELGTVKRRFSMLRRIYSVYDKSGRERYQLFGPILHPWTFNICDEQREYGKITKKWSGLLKESFTDADNFGVVFPEQWDVRWKAVFLGAVFLIDFVHFENTGNN